MGMIKSIILATTGHRDTDSNFSQLRLFVENIVKAWFNTGKHIEADLVTGANRVRHGLGRLYSGLIFEKRQGSVTLYETPDATNPKEYITINASAPLTDVKFYIY